MEPKTENRKSVYDQIAGEFIGMMEGGVVPWQRPWVAGWPKNVETKKEYKGINRVWLQIKGMVLGGSNWWGTYRQVANLGGQVEKGSKGTSVVFYKLMEQKDDKGRPVFGSDGKPKVFPMMRGATVFNLSQTDLDPKKFEVEHAGPGEIMQEPVQMFNEYLEREGIKFREGGPRAYYSPDQDMIALPMKETFLSGPGYIKTMYHEAIHSTGHESRLNRLSESACFGSEVYSKEELVAELGAAFFCHRFGILQETKENTAGYLASWLKALQDDPKMILQASSAAEKAYCRVCNEA